MHVSYLELNDLCKKVFEACDVPYGTAEDGAETVSWGEFGGLSGLEVLIFELEKINQSKMETIKLVIKDECAAKIDGGGQSCLLLGRIVSEYVYAQTMNKETYIVKVQNTSTSQLLAHQAYYLASNKRGCAIYCLTEEGPMWILAVPNNPNPILLKGNYANQIIQDDLIRELGIREIQAEKTNVFFIVCTKKIKFIASLISQLRNKTTQKDLVFIDLNKVEEAIESAQKYGGEVDSKLWNELFQMGKKILVESSEDSRLRGTGELA